MEINEKGKLKYKYELNEHTKIMMGSDSTTNIATYIARQVQLVYSRLLERDARSADGFRAAVTVLFSDPDSPVWTERNEVREGVDCFIMSTQKKGDRDGD